MALKKRKSSKKVKKGKSPEEISEEEFNEDDNEDESWRDYALFNIIIIF